MQILNFCLNFLSFCLNFYQLNSKKPRSADSELIFALILQLCPGWPWQPPGRRHLPISALRENHEEHSVDWPQVDEQLNIDITCDTLFLTAIWNVSLSSLAVEYATLRYLPYAIWTHQKSSNIRFANIIIFDIFDDMWLIFHLSLGLPGLRPDCNSSILVEPMFSKIIYFNK